MRELTVLLAMGLCLGGTFSHAQSLADVAKKEKERRKAVDAPSQVIDGEALSEAGQRGARSESSVTIRETESAERARISAKQRARAKASESAPAVGTGEVSLSTCTGELRGLEARKSAAQNQLSSGFPKRSGRPQSTVNRTPRDVITGTHPVDGSIVRSSRTAGAYQTVVDTITCSEAEADPLRHGGIVRRCEALREQIVALADQIAEKEKACEALRSP